MIVVIKCKGSEVNLCKESAQAWVELAYTLCWSSRNVLVALAVQFIVHMPLGRIGNLPSQWIVRSAQALCQVKISTALWTFTECCRILSF